MRVDARIADKRWIFQNTFTPWTVVLFFTNRGIGGHEKRNVFEIKAEAKNCNIFVESLLTSLRNASRDKKIGIVGKFF